MLLMTTTTCWPTAERSRPILDQGGVLIGDDYADNWPGVQQAANEFSAEVGANLEVNFPKWIIRKS